MEEREKVSIGDVGRKEWETDCLIATDYKGRKSLRPVDVLPCLIQTAIQLNLRKSDLQPICPKKFLCLRSREDAVVGSHRTGT